MRGLRRAFVVMSMGWALALPLATWAASRAHAPASWYAFAGAVYLAGRFVCHQLPTRSFHLWALQMPVCARCTGIYAAAAIAAAAGGLARPATDRRARMLIVLASLPTVATLAYEWTTGDAPSNGIRALAGVPLGAAVGWVVATAGNGGRPVR